MSGDITIGALKRISFDPHNDNVGPCIGGQNYWDVWFTGGEIQNAALNNCTFNPPLTGTPGGSNGQLQFNNGGAFGGLSNTQLTTHVNVFTSSLSGSVPASGGGTSNYLRADGTFAAPPGVGVKTYQAMTTGTTATVSAANTILDMKSATTGAKNITIPAADGTNIGEDIIVKDTAGSAATNNIIITPVSGTIDGASSVSITANKNSETLTSDGAGNWLLT